MAAELRRSAGGMAEYLALADACAEAASAPDSEHVVQVLSCLQTLSYKGPRATSCHPEKRGPERGRGKEQEQGEVAGRIRE